MSLDAEVTQLHAVHEDDSEHVSGSTEFGRRLRFLVCGSVDDGKSTLIGRLLWDTKSVSDDHRAALVAKGSRQNDLQLPDFGLLLDGLKAEQEQGITIDVAYRYFHTAKRAFIVADTPGHAQYTRNMATGASTADLAVLLVDARAGLLEQTRRHAAIVRLMGIQQVILAVNKIDLVGYDQSIFDGIAKHFVDYAERLGGLSITAIPISALKGENLVAAAPQTMPWYHGPTLLDALESAEGESAATLQAFRMPIQRVSRPGEGFRGYQGTIAAGQVRPGDRLIVHPSGESVAVSRIVTFDGDKVQASAGDAVTLVFDRPVDAARGDLVARSDEPPMKGRSYRATIVSLQGEGISSGTTLWLRASGRERRARVTVREIYDLAQGVWLAASALPINSIGRVELDFAEDMVFDRFEDCRETGAFILVSPETNNTLAGGMIVERLDRERQVVDEVTLTMPRDLAEFILGLPGVRARLDEIVRVPTG
jgi:sulfate adenylyltransferase subunit 1